MTHLMSDLSAEFSEYLKIFLVIAFRNKYLKCEENSFTNTFFFLSVSLLISIWILT